MANREVAITLSQDEISTGIITDNTKQRLSQQVLEYLQDDTKIADALNAYQNINKNGVSYTDFNSEEALSFLNSLSDLERSSLIREPVINGLHGDSDDVYGISGARRIGAEFKQSNIDIEILPFSEQWKYTVIVCLCCSAVMTNLANTLMNMELDDLERVNQEEIKKELYRIACEACIHDMSIEYQRSILNSALASLQDTCIPDMEDVPFQSKMRAIGRYIADKTERLYHAGKVSNDNIPSVISCVLASEAVINSPCQKNITNLNTAANKATSIGRSWGKVIGFGLLALGIVAATSALIALSVPTFGSSTVVAIAGLEIALDIIIGASVGGVSFAGVASALTFGLFANKKTKESDVSIAMKDLGDESENSQQVLVG